MPYYRKKPIPLDTRRRALIVIHSSAPITRTD